MSLYVKNIAGEIFSISIPLYLLSDLNRSIDRLHIVKKEIEKISCINKPFNIHIISYQHLSLDEKKEEEECLYSEWREGGIITYFLEYIQLSISFSNTVDLLYTIEDYDKKNPYCLLNFYIYSTKKENKKITTYKTYYTYNFALSFRTGKFICLKDNNIIFDDNDSFIYIPRDSEWVDDIYTMIINDLSIPSDYINIILRSYHRKWIKFTKRQSRMNRIPRSIPPIFMEKGILQIRHLKCINKSFFRDKYKEACLYKIKKQSDYIDQNKL